MIPFDLPPWTVLTALFVVGVVVGRWLNLCVERIPYRERMFDQFRVACDRITRVDVFAAGLPVIGPLTASGSKVFGSRRRGARAAIVELLNGGLLALLYWCEIPFDAEAGPLASHSVITIGRDLVWPFSSEGTSVSTLLHVRFLLHVILIQSLIVATFVDFDLRIIPSSSTDPFTVFGLLAGWLVGPLHLAPVWIADPELVSSFTLQRIDRITLLSLQPVPAWIAAHPHWHGLAASAAGVVAGAAIVYGVRFIGSWALGREAMGQGDAYLMMTIGAFLGWQAVVIVFFLAPMFALLAHALLWVVDPDGEIPYGPYLSLAAVVVMLFWQTVFGELERFFSLGWVLPVIAGFMTVAMTVCLLLMRGLKAALGLQVDWDDEDAETTPARPRATSGNASTSTLHGRTWPGSQSARGTRHVRIWRNGPR